MDARLLPLAVKCWRSVITPLSLSFLISEQTGLSSSSEAHSTGRSSLWGLSPQVTGACKSPHQLSEDWGAGLMHGCWTRLNPL